MQPQDMSDDRSLDIVGLGKLAKAIPDQAWTSAVDTACSTFKQVIAPITALTSGTGRLIEAKFDRLVDAEKVIVSQTLLLAEEKSSRSRHKRKGNPKPSIILKVIEESSSEVDLTLRELWTNLLANELVDNSIHPELVRILQRLSALDAQMLLAIARASDPKLPIRIIFMTLEAVSGVSMHQIEPENFILAHLSSLDLIKRSDGAWKLTITGSAFLEAVSDPTID
jgi:hypothetical protein